MISPPPDGRRATEESLRAQRFRRIYRDPSTPLRTPGVLARFAPSATLGMTSVQKGLLETTLGVSSTIWVGPSAMAHADPEGISAPERGGEEHEAHPRTQSEAVATPFGNVNSPTGTTEPISSSSLVEFGG